MRRIEALKSKASWLLPLRENERPMSGRMSISSKDVEVFMRCSQAGRKDRHEQ